MKHFVKGGCALGALALLLSPEVGLASASVVTAQPNLNSTVSPFAIDPAADPMPEPDEMARLLRDKIRYVFVIFNENESFDHEFGAFPGVNGLYSDGESPRSPSEISGFTQTYTDVNGAAVRVQPFRIGAAENATFADSTDHSHAGLAFKLDVQNGVAKMDRFAQDEYNRYAGTPANPATPANQKKAAQYAELVMAHVDCETIPFFWQYANRFTIFDNIFATEDTPSSPNAIAMIAGQSGESQWVEHGATAPAQTLPDGAINGRGYAAGAYSPAGDPINGDEQPFWGSAFDPTTAGRQPNGPKEGWLPSNTLVNQTYATVPLTLAGPNVAALMSSDNNAALDQADIATDIPYIASHTTQSVEWRWYQNGYSAEPNEPAADPKSLPEAVQGRPDLNYVSHHNGPQYFGYIANNPAEQTNLRGENDFFKDVLADKLPAGGGVIYIRGGYYNIQGQTPPIQNPNYPNPAGLTPAEIKAIGYAKSGDDDHPGYSDHQLSEAMNARVINAIASHPEIWSQSAIVLTYDESDGLYDHAPPTILSYGPDGLPQARGIRVPLLLISPFARAGAVSHAEGDHNSVIETINAVFGLPALSSLPAESAALAAGDSPAFNQFGPAGFRQKYLGPRDTNSPITDSLLSGFSPKRLRGLAPPLPASYATIPSATVESLPHFAGKGCAAIGVTPTDEGSATRAPAGFNTLPSTLPAYN